MYEDFMKNHNPDHWDKLLDHDHKLDYDHLWT